MESFQLSGQIVDLVQRKIYPGRITIRDGRIVSLNPVDKAPDHYILPGFIDAHIHVESSMLIPSEFARLAVIHGTVATVSDPHEIGNVLGIEGVRYMIHNGSQVPFHFYFGAPSCVPATVFETAGSSINVENIVELFDQDKLKYLSEVMNYPGVLQRDPEVMDKIAAAKKYHLPVDGHAPGLRGEQAKQYISAGIATDHECYSLPEALDKLKYGMHIIIREGSAAKNYNALHSLIETHPEKVMFCSDDKHPHELVKGHINEIVKRSIVQHGYDIMDVLRCASFNPIQHYKLDVGQLQKGDPADFIVVNNLTDLNVQQTYIKGQLVADHQQTLISSVESPIINHFHTSLKTTEDFFIKSDKETVRVIHALDGQLITKSEIGKVKIIDHNLVSNVENDLLKLAVINRYENAPVSIGFIKGFGLKAGAIASCIAHDSHNIIAVGTTDEEICRAVNAIIQNKGGISVSNGEKVNTLPLPIAGIMSHLDGFEVARAYSALDQKAKDLGTSLSAPFMTLSFMALLVIPSLKLSDKGLFDGNSFSFTSLVT